MQEHRKIRVSGRVQGVFFRDSAKRKADELGVRGFVRNDPDGTVYLEAEGENGALENLILWCWEGPESAKVDLVEVKKAGIKNFPDFKIED